MKLRNKITGAIHDIDELPLGLYNSLAEIMGEWEDYEEPKVGYMIDHMEEDYISADDSGYDESDIERAKELGLWFESEEEAERAVEKLKAWKLLKDRGFVWQGWEEGSLDNGMCIIGCQIPEDGWETDVVECLDLLFGGEE